MTGASPEVLTLGEAMVVFVPEQTGPLRHAERFGRALAGAESNVAIGLSRLGHAAAWIGRVGDDEFGRYILATLRGEGVDLSGAATDARGPTGIMFKERRAGADSRVFYYRSRSAASLLDAPDIPEAVFPSARWLHLTGITPALGPGPLRAARRALELARHHGLGISFDPNYRARLWSVEEARPVLAEFAGACDVLLLSEGEGELLYGPGDPAALAAAARATGPAVVACKLGAQGAYVLGAEGAFTVPAAPTALVEPTGAGDAFAAGFISGMLHGWPVVKCGRLGALCGALVCAVAGDWEGAPERETALAGLEGQSPAAR